MNRFRSVIFFGWLALLTIVVGACASASPGSYYQSDGFNNDPLSYLVGEWEGEVDSPGAPLPPQRILIIPFQPSGSTLYGYYGIERGHLGKRSISVQQFDGHVGIKFYTGFANVTLWLERMGNDYVLQGELKSANLPNPMILRKNK